MAGITKREQTNRKISAAVSKMRPEVIGKLEQAFAIDCTIEEACSYAEIHKDTFYEWMKKNPELSDRIEQLRQRPVLKARQTVINALGNSLDAKWYLEKKRKKEFGNALDVTTDGDKITPDVNKFVEKLTMRLNEIYRGTSITGDGGAASPLGLEAQNKE